MANTFHVQKWLFFAISSFAIIEKIDSGVVSLFFSVFRDRKGDQNKSSSVSRCVQVH